MDADALLLLERDGHDGVVVREEVGLCEPELVVEHVEELPLDAAHVALAKDTGAERPVDVLQCGVIAVLERIGGSESATSARTGDEEEGTHLVREDERSQEDALACPLLEGDLQVRFCAVDVDQRD